MREMPRPDPRVIFGYYVFTAMVALAAMFGLGTVKKESSYGLDFLMGGITLMAGGWTQWAFSKPDSSRDEEIAELKKQIKELLARKDDDGPS